MSRIYKFFLLFLLLFALLSVSCSDSSSSAASASESTDSGSGSGSGSADSLPQVIRLEKGVNTFKVPEGKTLYTLAMNIPDQYGSGTGNSISIRGSSFKGPAKKLIPATPTDQDELKTTRTDVSFSLLDGWTSGVSPSVGTAAYLGVNAENKILFYAEENALRECFEKTTYTSADGVECETYVDLKDEFIPRLNTILNSAVLRKEREYFGLSEYDMDETGYFHVVFNDFGSHSARYRGSMSASGTVGVYSPREIRSYYNHVNLADMIYINTRYIDIVVKDFQKYLQTTYDEARLKSNDIILPEYLLERIASDIAGTIVHEYMHCLMDCNICVKKGSSHSLSGASYSVFWVEGMAEAASYLMRGARKNQHIGFIEQWLTQAHKMAPSLTETEDSCVSYAVAPMFFLYLKETYGDDVLRKFAQYTDSENNLNKIVTDCTGLEFGTLYRAFLLRLFAPLTGSDQYGKALSFAEDWSMSADVIDKYECYVKAEESVAGNISSGAVSFVKWTENPETLLLNSNCEVYALFI